MSSPTARLRGTAAGLLTAALAVAAHGAAGGFPAMQTYSDGTVVRWDQPPQRDGGEPEYPAPMLTMTEVQAEAADHHPAPVAQVSTTDNSARWLAGGALTVSAVAVAAALLARRRS